jgi:hypothetical protein
MAAICDLSQNPPIPPWARLLSDSEVTPAIVAEAWTIAGDVSLPIGYDRKKWISGLPVYLRCECHAYTLVHGEKISGRYHGATAYRIIDPAQYPGIEPKPQPKPDAIEQKKTNWGLVGATAAAIAGTCLAFGLVLRYGGASPKRA